MSKRTVDRKMACSCFSWRRDFDYNCYERKRRYCVRGEKRQMIRPIRGVFHRKSVLRKKKKNNKKEKGLIALGVGKKKPPWYGLGKERKTQDRGLTNRGEKEGGNHHIRYGKGAALARIGKGGCSQQCTPMRKRFD